VGLPRDELKEVLLHCAANNIRVAGIAGAGGLGMLDLYEEVDRRIPLKGRRWVLEHVYVLSPRDIERIVVRGDSYMTVSGPVNIPGAWIITNQTITPTGQPFTGPPPPACLTPTDSEQPCYAALDQLHLRQRVTYQPADRYWTFQWYETAILLTLAAGLAALSTWRVRRLRLS